MYVPPYSYRREDDPQELWLKVRVEGNNLEIARNLGVIQITNNETISSVRTKIASEFYASEPKDFDFLSPSGSHLLRKFESTTPAMMLLPIASIVVTLDPNAGTLSSLRKASILSSRGGAGGTPASVMQNRTLGSGTSKMEQDFMETGPKGTHKANIPARPVIPLRGPLKSRVNGLPRNGNFIRLVDRVKEKNREEKQEDDFPDIFISYRRDHGSEMACLIKQSLEADGYKVFLDVDNLNQGRFDDKLLRKIGQAKAFVLVLTEGALNERVQSEDDWLRKEIGMALKLGKKIVPVTKKEFSFPKQEALPEDIQTILKMNAITWMADYRGEVCRRIEKFLGMSPRRKSWPHAPTLFISPIPPNPPPPPPPQPQTNQPEPPAPPTITPPGAASLYISFDPSDGPFAKQLAKSLEKEHFTISGSEDFSAGGVSKNDAIEAAGALIFCASKTSVNSNLCKEEFQNAQQLKKNIVIVYTSPRKTLKSDWVGWRKCGHVVEFFKPAAFPADVQRLVTLLSEMDLSFVQRFQHRHPIVSNIIVKTTAAVSDYATQQLSKAQAATPGTGLIHNVVTGAIVAASVSHPILALGVKVALDTAEHLAANRHAHP